MDPRRVVIMGAAGRDFHNFNVVYRDDPSVKVVAFTATQIPGIADRRYPPELAGPLYDDGIPIRPEAISRRSSGTSTSTRSSSPTATSATRPSCTRRRASSRPAPTSSSSGRSERCSGAAARSSPSGATRTGAGKSQTTRYLAALLAERGITPVVVRHPMPYGDLAAQRGPAVRHLRRPRSIRDDDRGARGVRAASRRRASRLRRRRLRGDPSRGRARGRRHPVGRRQQRLPVLPTGPVHRRRRSASPWRRAALPPGRDERPDGRRRHHQQGRLGRTGRG